MPYRVEVSARAARDLDAIFAFIRAEQSEQAFAWFRGLTEALGSLSFLPRRSPAALEGAGLRQLLYGRRPHVYRIVYRVDDERQTVSIVHIRHRARRPDRRN